jgi:hypothetical protein
MAGLHLRSSLGRSPQSPASSGIKQGYRTANMGYAIPALLVQNGRMHGERQSDIRIAQQRPLSHRTKVAEVRNTGFTITEADFKPVTRLARQGPRQCRLTAFKIQRTK